MRNKLIRCSLNPKSIEKAMQEIKEYKQEIIRKTELLGQRVAERISETASQGFGSAVVDDLLRGGARSASVDVSVDTRGNVSVVIAKGEDAVWVEFGAGVYHNGSAGSSPHPKGGELGMTIGGYGKGHGERNVWGFYEDGELVLTHGTPAAMPMYNAMKTVCEEVVDIAREVFND